MLIAYIIVFSALCVVAFFTMLTLTRFLKEKMSMTGYAYYSKVRRFINPEKLLHIQIVSGILAFAIIICILIFFGIFSLYIILPAAFATGGLGSVCPFLFFIFKARARQLEIENGLLNFILTLTNSMKAGLGLPQSLEAVTKRSSGAIQEEFQLLLREYRLGLELTEAFERLSERVPCEDMKLLVTTIKLTTKSGGSLVEVLSEMIVTIRQRTEFKEKLKTMTAQGRFEAIAISLAPLIAFGILWCIDKELMKPMFTTGIGWCAIGIIAVLIGTGFFFINKIVTIEV